MSDQPHEERCLTCEHTRDRHTGNSRHEDSCDERPDLDRLCGCIRFVSRTEETS